MKISLFARVFCLVLVALVWSGVNAQCDYSDNVVSVVSPCIPSYGASLDAHRGHLIVGAPEMGITLHYQPASFFPFEGFPIRVYSSDMAYPIFQTLHAGAELEYGSTITKESPLWSFDYPLGLGLNVQLNEQGIVLAGYRTAFTYLFQWEHNQILDGGIWSSLWSPEVLSPDFVPDEAKIAAAALETVQDYYKGNYTFFGMAFTPEASDIERKLGWRISDLVRTPPEGASRDIERVVAIVGGPDETATMTKYLNSGGEFDKDWKPVGFVAQEDVVGMCPNLSDFPNTTGVPITFGASVALSSDGNRQYISYPDQLYVQKMDFHHTTSQWTISRSAILCCDPAVCSRQFGVSMDLTDDFLIVGDPGASSVHVFPSTMLTQRTIIHRPHIKSFGTIVYVVGSWLFVTAPDHGTHGTVFAFSLTKNRRNSQVVTDACSNEQSVDDISIHEVRSFHPPVIPGLEYGRFGSDVLLNDQHVMIGSGHVTDSVPGAVMVYENDFYPESRSLLVGDDMRGQALSTSHLTPTSVALPLDYEVASSTLPKQGMVSFWMMSFGLSENYPLPAHLWNSNSAEGSCENGLDHGLELAIDSVGHLHLRYPSSSGCKSIDSTAAIVNRRWTSVSVTWTDEGEQSLRIFIDGESSAHLQGQTIDFWRDGGQFRLGSFVDAEGNAVTGHSISNAFVGLLDELVIAPTIDLMRYSYPTLNSLLGSSVIGYWDFNSLNASTLSTSVPSIVTNLIASVEGAKTHQHSHAPFAVSVDVQAGSTTLLFLTAVWYEDPESASLETRILSKPPRGRVFQSISTNKGPELGEEITEFPATILDLEGRIWFVTDEIHDSEEYSRLEFQTVAGEYSPGRESPIARVSFRTQCPKGTAKSGSVCVDCQAGTFSAVLDSDKCHDCPRGSFSPQAQSTSCTECAAGSYQHLANATACIDCDTRFSNCTYPGAFYPSSKEGFWVEDRGEQVVVLECTPKESCLPCNKVEGEDCPCSEGYIGRSCSQCDDRYYRLEMQCTACPSEGDTMLFNIIVGIALLVLIPLIMKTSSTLKLESLKTFIDFVQVTSLFGSIEVGWPDSILQILKKLTFFNLNVQLLHPDCQVTNAFTFVYVATFCLPIFIIGTAVIIYGSSALHNRIFASYYIERWESGKTIKETHLEKIWRKFCAPKSMAQVYNSLTEGVFFALTVLYLQECRVIIGLLDCSENTDGQKYVDSNPSIQCSFEDETFAYLFPFCMLGLIFYVAGIPLLVARSLYSVRNTLAEESSFLRYGFLYFRYEIDYFWWSLAILLRKLAIICASLLFSKEPLKQILLSLLVLGLAMLAQFYARPFHSTATDILESSLLVCSFTILIFGFSFFSSGVSDRMATVLEVCSNTMLGLSFVLLAGLTFLEVRTALRNKRRQHQIEERDRLKYESAMKERNRKRMAADEKRWEMVRSGSAKPGELDFDSPDASANPSKNPSSRPSLKSQGSTASNIGRGVTFKEDEVFKRLKEFESRQSVSSASSRTSSITDLPVTPSSERLDQLRGNIEGLAKKHRIAHRGESSIWSTEDKLLYFYRKFSEVVLEEKVALFETHPNAAVNIGVDDLLEMAVRNDIHPSLWGLFVQGRIVESALELNGSRPQSPNLMSLAVTLDGNMSPPAGEANGATTPDLPVVGLEMPSQGSPTGGGDGEVRAESPDNVQVHMEDPKVKYI